MIELDLLKQWIGRQERVSDRAAAAPIAGLSALLDHDGAHWPAGHVPPLGHWLYFLPRARQSLIASDGHPRRGDFLPPVPLPRRMWAGGKLVFHAPIALEAPIERLSTVTDVAAKSGSTGEMVFVTVVHRIMSGGVLLIEERQDIVYRGDAETPARSAPTPEIRPSQAMRTIEPDPAMLFRYSALTFNAHRIHYDRDYARDVEHYPGLVVQGPFCATLLLDHYLRETPGANMTEFAFRARRPLFDTAPFHLHLERTETGADLWTADHSGQPAMTASVRIG